MERRGLQTDALRRPYRHSDILSIHCISHSSFEFDYGNTSRVPTTGMLGAPFPVWSCRGMLTSHVSLLQYVAWACESCWTFNITWRRTVLSDVSSVSVSLFINLYVGDLNHATIDNLSTDIQCTSPHLTQLISGQSLIVSRQYSEHVHNFSDWVEMSRIGLYEPTSLKLRRRYRNLIIIIVVVIIWQIMSCSSQVQIPRPLVKKVKCATLNCMSVSGLLISLPKAVSP